MQIFAMVMITLIMMVIFLSNVALRPYVFVSSGALLALMGWVNGYTSAKLLKFFGTTDWKSSICLAIFAFPTWLISTLSIVDVIEWDTESSAFLPYTYALGMVFLWLLFTIPLSTHGAYTGFMDKSTQKAKVNLVQRLIPDQPCFTHPVFTVPIFGGIIFASIVIEFYYVLDSMWHSYTIFAMFGFVLINLYLMTIVVSLLSTL